MIWLIAYLVIGFTIWLIIEDQLVSRVLGLLIVLPFWLPICLIAFVVHLKKVLLGKL